MRRATTLSRLLARPAVAFCSLAVVAIMTEGAIRAVERLRGSSEEYEWQAASRWRALHRLSESRDMLYELVPGSSATIDYGARGSVVYRISSQGVRGPERTVPKPHGVHRILILGDSVTFGYYVPEELTFVALLETALRRLDPAVEVINGGVGGYNTHNEISWLKERGLAFEPDVVVLAFCPNDVDNPRFHFAWHTLDRLGPLPPEVFPDSSIATIEPTPPGGLLFSLRKHSRLAALLSHRMDLLRVNVAVSAARRGGERGRKALLGLPYGDCLDALCESGSPRRQWLTSHLRTLDSLRAAQGFDLLVLHVPLSYQSPSGPGLCARDAVAAIADSVGIVFVDPLQVRPSSDRLFFDVTHLTPCGHRWVARALDNALRPMLSDRSQSP